MVLFVDGHRSHLTQQVSNFCHDNGIILISLLPNTTHITQPADVSVFKPLKSGWKSCVRDWKFENFPKDVTSIHLDLLSVRSLNNMLQLLQYKMDLESAGCTLLIKIMSITPNVFQIEPCFQVRKLI